MEKMFKPQRGMETKDVTVAEARVMLMETEMEKYLSSEQIQKDAIQVCLPSLEGPPPP